MQLIDFSLFSTTFCLSIQVEWAGGFRSSMRLAMNPPVKRFTILINAQGLDSLTERDAKGAGRSFRSLLGCCEYLGCVISCLSSHSFIHS